MTDAQVEHQRHIEHLAEKLVDAGASGMDSIEEIRDLARYLIENGAWEVPFTYGGAMHPQIMQEELDEMIAKQKEMLGE